MFRTTLLAIRTSIVFQQKVAEISQTPKRYDNAEWAARKANEIAKEEEKDMQNDIAALFHRSINELWAKDRFVGRKQIGVIYTGNPNGRIWGDKRYDVPPRRAEKD